jgi:hypothetical protein
VSDVVIHLFELHSSAVANHNRCAPDLALTKGHQPMVEFLEAHGAKL